MAKQTPLLLKPTLDELLLFCTLEHPELPTDQVHAFWCYYESNGWKVGKNPMKCWKSALSGWKIRWADRMKSNESRRSSQMPISMKVRAIEKTLESHVGNPDGRGYARSTDKDREEFRDLKKKLNELYKLISRS